MVTAPDEDVRDMRSSPGGDDEDGDTTAAAKAPATPAVPATPGTGVATPWATGATEEDQEEDHTVRQELDPKLQRAVQAARAAAHLARTPEELTPRRPLTLPLPSGLKISSKKMTVVGIGGPVVPTHSIPPESLAPRTTLSAGTNPPAPAALSTIPKLHTEADAIDDSVTATAPAPRAGRDSIVPAAVPGSVRIVEMRADEDDEEALDETEARTIVTTQLSPQTIGSGPATEADEPDDSVTTRAPAYIEDATLAPAMRPAAGMPAAAHDEDESVTTRGPAHLGLDDSTDGTTSRVPALASRSVPKLRPEGAAEEEDEIESITTQAPSLGGLLRGGIADDAEDKGNQTAVMIGAPVKPPPGMQLALRPAAGVAMMPHGNAAIADLREPTPSSDSGLRIAPAPAPSGDHASIATLLGTFDGDRASGSLRDAAPNPFAATVAVPQSQPGLPGAPPRNVVGFAATVRKPSYGIVVGLVAFASLAVPLVLYLMLHRGDPAEDVATRAPSELARDPVLRDDTPRPKFRPGSSAASAAPGASHARPGPAWPFKRR